MLDLVSPNNICVLSTPALLLVAVPKPPAITDSEPAAHGATRDIAENGPTGTDQGTNHAQQVIAEHESLGESSQK